MKGAPENPLLSVIIPTHDRKQSLWRTLQALTGQSYPAERMEVIVVADGCSDGTAEFVRAGQWPFSLEVLEQRPGCGAGAARNRGAAQARGLLLLFLDDDIEPTRELVQAHVRAHMEAPGRAIMGPYPPALRGPAPAIHMAKRAWWHDKFTAMAQPWHRFTYRDLVSGNLSMAAALFAEMGGFDERIPGAGGEDYELGARLIEKGIRFGLEPQALGWHHEHETTDVARFFARARQEGRSEVQIGRRHAALRHGLDLAAYDAPRPLLARRLRAWALARSAVGERIAHLLACWLAPLEWMRSRRRWLRLAGMLREYWYWRGVVDELGSRAALESYLQGGPLAAESGACEIELDLRLGIPWAECKLDELRPLAVRLRHGRFPVGRIPAQAGAEPLRGCHLRPILAGRLAWPLLRAMAAEGEFMTGSVTRIHPEGPVRPDPTGTAYVDQSA